ncbi:MAG TPA: polysaccharide biosynthesis protein [Bacteroidales bacterium]|nr:polysaccharide biosynthesis protein [Bacteroidales bacterium]
MFKNKTLLITGGTGSFGTAVLDRFLSSPIGEIRIFSRDEKKQDDLRRQVNNPKVKFYIGDVRDRSSIDKAIPGVDFIFHAAALKQVPSCEFFPLEAVKTNILGTANVLEAAVEHEVKKVVVLSTDKACYPVNAMGMSKALMEKVMIAQSRSVPEQKTMLCGTRYGNVLASRGSVIPLFIEQLRAGKPLTLTDPAMTRFIMTIEEAVDLVLHAFEHGHAGDIFVQKSPAATIGVMAAALQEIYHSKAPVSVIGTRHGEKLFETLVNREEMVKATDLGKYFRIQADTRDLNYNPFFTEGTVHVSEVEEYTSHNTRQLTVSEMKEILMKLEPVRQDLNSHD